MSIIMRHFIKRFVSMFLNGRVNLDYNDTYLHIIIVQVCIKIQNNH